MRKTNLKGEAARWKWPMFALLQGIIITAAVAAPSVVIIDNTAIGGVPAVVTNHQTSTLADGNCSQQDVIDGKCNYFSDDNLQTVQRTGDGGLRLDIGVSNPSAARYGNAGTHDQLDYFADGKQLFDLNKFRRAANALSALKTTTSAAPAGTYGTISWRQFLTNIAEDRTMYGIVRVKIVLPSVTPPPGGGGTPPGECRPRETGEHEHEDEHDDDKSRQDDHRSESSGKSKAKVTATAFTSSASHRQDSEEHEDDDEHEGHDCDDIDHDEEDDHDRVTRKGDKDDSVIDKAIQRAKSLMTAFSKPETKSAKAKGEHGDKHAEHDDDDRHRYKMCPAPRAHKKEHESDDDKHASDHKGSENEHSGDSKKSAAKSKAGSGGNDDSNSHVAKSDDEKSSDREHEGDDDDDEDEHIRRVCACQPRFNEPLKRGQTYCDGITISKTARIKVRGALLFDFINEQGEVIPRRSLPTPNELPIPLAMPLNINAANDVNDDGVMDNILNVAAKSRSKSCKNQAKSCSMDLQPSIDIGEIPWVVRESYATRDGQALSAAAFNAMPLADRYHLQMPSGYAQGWREAFSALNLSPSAWRDLGFEVPAGATEFTLNTIRSSKFEDVPALMYQGGLVRLVDRVNISGMVYVPEVLVMGQQTPDITQYINGAVLVRDGFSIGSNDNGTTLLSHDRGVYDHLTLSSGSGVAAQYIPPSNRSPGNPADNTDPNQTTFVPRRGTEWVEVRAR